MSHGNWGSRLLWAAGIVTALAVAAGVWIIDSPAQQRLQRLDDSRVQDLRNLDSAIRSYRQSHDQLPSDLAALAAQPGMALNLSDPQGGPDYRYRRLDESHFELCARFATASNVGLRRGTAFNAWNHPSGEHCYRRSLQDED
ncbi:hypothetical protein ARC78_05920 [Stenotrophomonas pictorum JCM 9942]|uniref:Type II secretion system protein GspG C-terminal domain-containing protein n=1 Tax=Stenotrophomonas pictorum JCM 9942 TaxID=1236960 RepID=A0A0R0AGK5_9GAMM|nr:hypothetical protein [Stenotrophomonas pictorum]KRG44093.1 hypothetical protein ARC78_05920 [Stenotrophomonas pictorum JCM 9942]